MGWAAARKLRRSVDGLTRVLAVEVLTACASARPARARWSRRRPPARSGALVRRARRRARARPPPRPRDRGGRGARRERRRRTNRGSNDRRAGMNPTDETNPRLPIRAARGTAADRPVVADRGAAADADEQPRPRERREPRGARRLRRLRQGRARLAVVRRPGADPGDARRRRDDARAERPPRRGLPHPRVGAAGAHRQLQPGRRLGQLGGVPPPRAPRADDVRPDDGRLLDLHRHPGHPPGHLRDVRRRGREARDGGGHRRGRLAGRHDHPHRRARRDGRRPAARGHDERRRRDLHRVRPGADRAAHRAPLPRRPRGLARPRARAGGRRARRAASAVDRGAGQRRRDGAGPARAGGAHRRRHRPDLSAHDPLYYLPVGVAFEDWQSERESGPGRVHQGGSGSRWPRTCAAMVGFADRGAEVFDYGNSIRDEARKGGYDRAFDFPGFVPAYIRPLFCEGKGPFRWAALSGDPADIARDRPGDPRALPRRRAAAPLDHHGGRAGRLPGPAGAHLLAGVRRAPPGRAELQRDGGQRGAEGPDRHRSRPPRLRLGGQPLPRDRGDARRLRRHRRLGAAQRPGQHRLRRDLGLDPPRRGRRHGEVDPRRPGLRGRRHRPGGAEDRAGADQRPRDGRHPPRRRGLRPGGRGGGASAASASRCARPESPVAPASGRPQESRRRRGSGRRSTRRPGHGS